MVLVLSESAELFLSVLISYSVNPKPCRAEATTDKISDTAPGSFPVTSTSRFVVVVVTVVNAELIIGGNDIVFFCESKIIGTIEPESSIAE